MVDVAEYPPLYQLAVQALLDVRGGGGLSSPVGVRGRLVDPQVGRFAPRVALVVGDDQGYLVFARVVELPDQVLPVVDAHGRLAARSVVHVYQPLGPLDRPRVAAVGDEPVSVVRPFAEYAHGVAGVCARLAVDQRVGAQVVSAVVIVRDLRVVHVPKPPPQLHPFLVAARAAERRGRQADQHYAQLGHLPFPPVPVEVHLPQHVRVRRRRSVVRLVYYDARCEPCKLVKLARVAPEYLAERLHGGYDDTLFVEKVGHLQLGQLAARPPEPVEAQRRAPPAGRLEDDPKAAQGLLAQLFALRHPQDEL